MCAKPPSIDKKLAIAHRLYRSHCIYDSRLRTCSGSAKLSPSSSITLRKKLHRAQSSCLRHTKSPLFSGHRFCATAQQHRPPFSPPFTPSNRVSATTGQGTRPVSPGCSGPCPQRIESQQFSLSLITQPLACCYNTSPSPKSSICRRQRSCHRYCTICIPKYTIDRRRRLVPLVLDSQYYQDLGAFGTLQGLLADNSQSKRQ